MHMYIWLRSGGPSLPLPRLHRLPALPPSPSHSEPGVIPCPSVRGHGEALELTSEELPSACCIMNWQFQSSPTLSLTQSMHGGAILFLQGL